jgi:UPF0716 family protein affecting phage T7 exclusion
MSSSRVVRFSDLSTNLKIIVVAGWIGLAFNVFLFIVGFVVGFLSYY